MADKKRMKGITYCGECVYYNYDKHGCSLGAKEETNPKDPFYDDCPIPDIEQLDADEIRAKAIDEFVKKFIYKAVCEGCSGCTNCYENEAQNICDDWNYYMKIAEQMKAGDKQ